MLLPILLVSGFCLSAFGLLFWVLARRTPVTPCDVAGWIEGFSSAAYRPMERLFDNRDRSFLASQNGFEPAIVRQLRRERREIFHSYLGEMICDFHRLMTAAKYVTVYATHDQGSFEADLWRIRRSFYRAVVLVELQIQLERIGIVRVDTRGLFAPVERLREYTQCRMPAFE